MTKSEISAVNDLVASLKELQAVLGQIEQPKAVAKPKAKRPVVEMTPKVSREAKKAQNKVLASFKEAQKNAAHHSPGKCPSLDQPLPSKRKRVAPSLFEAVPAHQGGEKVARHNYLVEGTSKLKQGVTTPR